MKKFINKAFIQGYVFSHNLQERVYGPNSAKAGEPYIIGEVQIATDDEGMNIVPVHFSFINPFYAEKKDEQGKVIKPKRANETYSVLKQIMETGTTYQQAGTAATKIRVDGALDVNDYVSRNEEMVSAKRIKGSFANFTNENLGDSSATFEVDMLVDNTSTVEVDDSDDYMRISGNAFNFRNDLIPLTLTVRNPKGIEYFEGQDISKKNPLLVTVFGKFVSTTIVRKTEVETDWGEPSVDVTTRELRSWDVTGTSTAGMEFGETITVDELKECVERREETLANVRKRWEERDNSPKGKEGFPSTITSETIVEDDDEFPF